MNYRARTLQEWEHRQIMTVCMKSLLTEEEVRIYKVERALDGKGWGKLRFESVADEREAMRGEP
jgi:hypothetical protein